MLERLHTKIHRSPQRHKLTEAWDHSVSWYIGEARSPTIQVIKWTTQDTIEYRHRGLSWTFLNLAGNLIDAPIGFLEQQSAPENSPPLKIIASIGLGLLNTGLAVSNFSASCWTRLMLLQELIELTALHESDIAKLLLAIQSTGWGFVAHKEDWEHFLQIRCSLKTLDCISVMPKAEILDLGRWKHILGLTGKVRARKQIWNPCEINTHLALFCDTLANYLGHAIPRKQSQIWQLVVRESVGFPKELGNPEDFSAAWGARRSQLYKHRFWPDLV